MLDSSLLADVNRWVGVCVAVIGAVVVEPNGTRLLLQSSWAWLDRLVRRAHHALVRVLPFLRKDASVKAATATGSAEGTLTFEGMAEGRSASETGTFQEQLDSLRQLVAALKTEVSGLDAEHQVEVANLRRALDALEARLTADTHQMRQELDERERQDARINARGLPVIAAGIFLSGVPDQLAGWLYPFGWLWPIVALWLAVTAALPLVRRMFAASESASP